MTSSKQENANDAVRALLGRSEVWDLTLPWMPIYWDIEVLARYRRAGFTFVSATLQDWPPTFAGLRRCVEEFEAIITEASDWLVMARTLAEIDAGRAAGKLVLGINSQETCIIGEDLSLIAELSRLGVRHMLLAYNVRNLVADGCAEAADAGLSNFGRDVVAEMNRCGIVVDCTHTGRRSSLEAISRSDTPTIFSHSNPYSVCPNIRNITDEQIRACASGGGVVGVVGVGAYLGDEQATTESLFRHIDYIASLVGPEHVGLGSDFVDLLPVSQHEQRWRDLDDGSSSWPNPRYAWPDPTGKQIPLEESRCFAPEQLSELVGMMLAHGYPSIAIEGVLGSNFRRVYAAADTAFQRFSEDQRLSASTQSAT